MPNRRILVLYSKSLFAQAIETLLKKREELEVIGLDLDEGEILRQVTSLHPEAVIVDCDDLNAFGSTLVLQVLDENPEAKVLCVTVNDTSVDIYSKSQIEITKAEELVQAITNA